MTSNIPLDNLRPHTTHYACKARLDEYGGKTVGCCCVLHQCKTLRPSGSPEYRSWMAMRRRCRDPKVDSYPRYGGRGISVCARWNGKNGFANFLKDMGPRPNPRSSIDRIDVDGNYEPSNCRWATSVQQARNRHHRPNRSGHTGVSYWARRNKWQAKLYLHGKQVHLGFFATMDEAVTARLKGERKYWVEDDV